MWRDTASPLRVVGVDARVLIALVVWLYHWRWETFYLAVGSVAAFAIIEQFGLTVPAAWRLLRSRAIGPMRDAVPAWRQRRFG